MIRFSHLSSVGFASALALAATVVSAQTADPAAPAAPATPAATAAAATAAPAAGTIADNAAKTPNLTTLASAIAAADLTPTLSGPGPFTVFAPSNDAFQRVSGIVDTLMKPENKDSLVKVLGYHVVPGKLTLAELTKLTTEGGGTAKLTTIEGGTLMVKATPSQIELTDENGNKAYVSQPDLAQSNGVVHVTNGLVMPKLDAAAPASGHGAHR